jgi:hypothetical protein
VRLVEEGRGESAFIERFVIFIGAEGLDTQPSICTRSTTSTLVLFYQR